MKAPFFLSVLLSCFLKVSALQPNVLSKKIHGKTPEWMTAQIEKDLSPFQKQGVSEQSLHETLALFAQDPLTIRCKIMKRRVYLSYYDEHIPIISHARFRSLLYVLHFLTKYYTIPPVEFIISLHDTVDRKIEDPPLLAPVFTFAKNKHIASLVAFPDEEMLQGYKNLIDSVVEANARYPFEQKHNKAFWRGTTTGKSFLLEEWQTLPRAQLVLFGKNHSDLLDAKFTHVTQTNQPEQLTALLKEQNLYSKYVSVPDHIAFKYLVDMDGNSCTYSRFVWILFSNSLCLKQISDHEQWYYGELKPYVHYVPFKSDMSDFAEQMTWIDNHPEEVQMIIHNANTFARTHLTQEDAFQYVYALLCSYAKLQTFEPK
jgi:hypothetical protein